MSRVGAFLAGFALAAAAAGGAWALALRPRWNDFESRAAAAERASQRAAREAGEERVTADVERRRKRELEDEVERLQKAAAAPPSEPPAMNPRPRAVETTPPEQWDRRRLDQEIESLGAAGGRIVADPRYPLVVRALKAMKGGEGVQLMTDVLAQPFPPEMKAACATLLGRLGDERAEPALLAAFRDARDDKVRVAALRGLGELKGDGAVPTLLSVWNDPSPRPFERLLAIRGLARRKHPAAVAVVAGGAPGSTPPLRVEAMEMLHWIAWQEQWKDVSLVPVFGKALRGADGDGQRRVALLALEGFWSKDSVADLEAFADTAVSTELAARARHDADALRSGKPRPDKAGEPTESAPAPAPTHVAPVAPPPAAPAPTGPAEPVEPDDPK